MKLVDSHCHLDCLDLSLHQGSMDVVLSKAKQAGVERLLCVALALEKHAVLLQLAKTYAQVDISAGVHPNHTMAVPLTEEALLACAEAPEVLAVGETGLDYYRIDVSDQHEQQERFRCHIRVARTLGKPLIIHTRQASEDTLRILREEKADAIGGVFHCFTENWEIAKQALDLGFFISFSGIVSFKNALDLRETAKKVPNESFLIETDAPYLAPVPHRGKANEPAYVRHIAACLADLRGVSLDVVASVVWENYHRFVH